MTNVIGIDIGARGALALLSPTGELIEVADMPILRDGPANRPNVNAPLLASIVRRWRASQAFVEYVGARAQGRRYRGFRLWEVQRRHRRRLCRYRPPCGVPDSAGVEAHGRHPAGQGWREGRGPLGSHPTMAGPR